MLSFWLFTFASLTLFTLKLLMCTHRLFSHTATWQMSTLPLWEWVKKTSSRWNVWRCENGSWIENYWKKLPNWFINNWLTSSASCEAHTINQKGWALFISAWRRRCIVTCKKLICQNEVIWIWKKFSSKIITYGIKMCARNACKCPMFYLITN